MKILAIDPSIENIGVCILDGNKYVESYTLHTKAKSTSMIDRIRKIVVHFKSISTEYDYGVVLIEYPEAFMRKGDYGIKNVRAIQVLMVAIGVITASLVEKFDVHFVQVADWKGTTNKKITQFVAKGECGKDLNSHEADAFMMALHWNKTVRFKEMIRKSEGAKTKRKARNKHPRT